MDESGQLRVAAQTYRQWGSDFWPGPLTSGGATVDDVTCAAWDKHFLITKEEISSFRAAYLDAVTNGGSVNLDLYPAVKTWPAFGFDSDGNRLSLAPFVDVDGNDQEYNPGGGDFPDISPTAGGGSPDQAIWWVLMPGIHVNLDNRGTIFLEVSGGAMYQHERIFTQDKQLKSVGDHFAPMGEIRIGGIFLSRKERVQQFPHYFKPKPVKKIQKKRLHFD